MLGLMTLMRNKSKGEQRVCVMWEVVVVSMWCLNVSVLL